jgi:hypothetical protein
MSFRSPSPNPDTGTLSSTRRTSKTSEGGTGGCSCSPSAGSMPFVASGARPSVKVKTSPSPLRTVRGMRGSASCAWAARRGRPRPPSSTKTRAARIARRPEVKRGMPIMVRWGPTERSRERSGPLWSLVSQKHHRRTVPPVGDDRKRGRPARCRKRTSVVLPQRRDKNLASGEAPHHGRDAFSVVNRPAAP